MICHRPWGRRRGVDPSLLPRRRAGVIRHARSSVVTWSPLAVSSPLLRSSGDQRGSASPSGVGADASSAQVSGRTRARRGRPVRRPGLRPDPAAPRRSRTSATGGDLRSTAIGRSPRHPRCGSSSNASIFRRADCWQGLATEATGGATAAFVRLGPRWPWPAHPVRAMPVAPRREHAKARSGPQRGLQADRFGTIAHLCVRPVEGGSLVDE